MEFTLPAEKGYTIYTKENCPYCDKVKKLLESEPLLLIPCDKYLSKEKDKEAFLKFIEEKAEIPYRTFPMVFLDGLFIGGFTETKKQYEQQKMFQNFDCEF